MNRTATTATATRRSWTQRALYELIRWTTGGLGWLFFRLRIAGKQNWPAQGGGLVCSNHQSYFDPVLVGLACPRRVNYLARKTLFRFAPFRWLIQALDAIPIEREGMGIGGLKETLRRLKRGELVLIFPEGTRTSDGQMSPLKPGFIPVARRGRVPIIPVAIDGAYQAWPKHRRLPKLTAIRVAVGQPLSADECAAASDDQLLTEVEARIRQCLSRAQQSRGSHDQ